MTFVQDFFSWLLPFVQANGAWAVFVAVIIEEIIVPIPSPIVPMTAGFLLVPAGTPLIDASVRIFYLIALPGSIAIALGTLVIYAIGYYGEKNAIKRFRRFLGSDIADIDRISKRIGSGYKAWASIFLLRAVPIFPTSVVSLAAGVMHLDVKKFFVSTFLGAIPRMFFFSFAGWKLGAEYLAVAEKLDFVQDVVLAIFVIVILAGLYVVLKKKRKIIKHPKGAAHSRNTSV